MINIAIVIVNYRTSRLVVECLESLEADGYIAGHGRVVVVDNDSRDDSSQRISQTIAQNGRRNWMGLIVAARNGGFAYGNNLGIRASCARDSTPEYVLLLNPDTVVRPGGIEALVRFMEKHPKVGIAGSRLEGLEGAPQRSAFRFPTIWSEIDGGAGLGIVTRLLRRHVVAPEVRNDTYCTDWVAGASMIIRRQLLEQIGLLDESYFMYFEEVDLCFRAKRAGWECWYVPESRIVHLVGQASGIDSAVARPPRRPAYWFESRRRYFQKNHGRVYAALADTAWLAGNLTWKIRRVLQRKPGCAPPHFWRDMLRHSALWHGIKS